MATKSNIGNIYLLFYNLIQFIGWSFVFYEFIKYLLSSNLNNVQLWSNAFIPLAIFQTLQLIEVLHCSIGLVRSSPVTTFQQIISRIIVLWAVVYQFKEVRSSYGVPLILGSWSLAETTRYLYYAFNLFSTVPYLLTWCRYSFFLVLYPTGVTGELILLLNAVKYLKTHDEFNYPLPNPLNISFYFYISLEILIFLYVPLFPQMYLYMVGQRKKVLGGPTKLKSK